MREGQKRDTARSLRHTSTDTERAMWRLLRNRRLEGIKFRRQVPIGPFVADFASIAHRIVVELDGTPHSVMEGNRHLWYNLRQPPQIGLAAPVASLLESLAERRPHTED